MCIYVFVYIHIYIHIQYSLGKSAKYLNRDPKINTLAKNNMIELNHSRVRNALNNFCARYVSISFFNERR